MPKFLISCIFALGSYPFHFIFFGFCWLGLFSSISVETFALETWQKQNWIGSHSNHSRIWVFLTTAAACELALRHVTNIEENSTPAITMLLNTPKALTGKLNRNGCLQRVQTDKRTGRT